MRLNNKYSANVNMDIALPDFVNKNEILSKRLMDNFMNDVAELQRKYSFDSIAFEMKVEKEEEYDDLLNVDEFIEYDPFGPEDMTLLPNYSNVTLKEIDDIVKQCCGDETKPLAYNVAHMTLQLLDSDIEGYVKAYEEEFPHELMNKFIDVQIKVRDLMDCLK